MRFVPYWRNIGRPRAPNHDCKGVLVHGRGAKL